MSWVKILLGALVAYAIYKYVTTEHFSTGVAVSIGVGVVAVIGLMFYMGTLSAGY